MADPITEFEVYRHELLAALDPAPRPASALRIARLHGRGAATGAEARDALRASAAWQEAHAALTQGRHAA